MSKNINNFIWSDLSTFDINACKKFYSQLFNWEFNQTKDASMKELYEMAYIQDTAVSAVFVMPKYLQEINMPSFWMSYIRVENIDHIVEKAKNHPGVVIEVKPTEFDSQSKIALIRDPSGAGFTVYEGPDLQGRFNDEVGKMVWNIHHLKDINLVQDFYKDLFDWTVKSTDNPGVFNVHHKEGDIIATIEEHADETRGSKSYWMPIFSVQNMVSSKEHILNMGGKHLQDISDASMFADQQGGAFLLKELSTTNGSSKNNKKMKWKTISMLVLILFALIYGVAELVFGLLFLNWTAQAIRSDEVYLVEYISRSKHPFLFYVVAFMYLALIILSITCFVTGQC